MVLASPNDQKYPRYPLVFKFNVTLARPLRLVILYLFFHGNSCQVIGSTETCMDSTTDTASGIAIVMTDKT